MRILLVHRQASAVGYYRCWTRGRILKRLGYDVTCWDGSVYSKDLKPKNFKRMPPKAWVETWLKENVGEFDLLIMDRGVDHEEVGKFAGFKHFSPGCRMIVDFDDDFTNIPGWNPARTAYMPGQMAYEAGLNHLRLAEMVTVSTEPLAKAFAKRAHCVRVVPNLIDPVDWVDLPVDPTRSEDPHLRVLYGGAMGHYGDLDIAREGIEAMLRRQPVPWRLICLGAAPAWLHQVSRDMPGKVCILPWAPFEDYPKVVAWGAFDAAIAPLAEHPFNESKSTIKWQEAAIQGIPFLCSDVGPYEQIPAGSALTVKNTPAAWAQGLHDMLMDKALRRQFVRTAREAVQDGWTVDSGGQILHDVIEEAMSLPRIETIEQTYLPDDPASEPPSN